jgi:hypothetical protein
MPLAGPAARAVIAGSHVALAGRSPDRRVKGPDVKGPDEFGTSSEKIFSAAVALAGMPWLAPCPVRY